MLFKEIVIICLVIMVFFPIVLANLPTVSCVGCVRSDEITTDGSNTCRTFYAKENDRITLKGNSGFWENRNGQKISDGSSLTFAVKESDSYVLKTANGDFIATVGMIPLSLKLPETISDIYVNGDEIENHGKIEAAQGNLLKLKLIVTKGDCPAYYVEWTSDSPAITFSDSNSLSTTAYVGSYSGKNPTITITIYSENRERQETRDIRLEIRKNTPPSIDIYWEPDSVKSYERFTVYFYESTSGSSGDEIDDYIRKVSATLQKPGGNKVTNSRTMDEDDSLEGLSFNTGERGEHHLTATITDRYGATDTADVTILVTEKGDSGRDKPMIDVAEDIYCAEGSCDFSVRSVDKNVFIDYSYQGKKMVKPFNLSPGDHEILIKAYSLDENGRRKNEITKTVYAHVTADSNTSAIAEPANVAPIAREDPTETQKSPPGIVPLAIGLFAAALFARRRMSGTER